MIIFLSKVAGKFPRGGGLKAYNSYMFENTIPVFWALGTSLAVCLLILFTAKWHGRWTLDHVFGAQKFHQDPTPRIGGLAIIAGALAAFTVSSDSELVNLLRPILVCGLIPFFFGFREDVTKRVSVFERLSASFAAAAGVIWLTGLYLNHVDVWGLDTLFQFSGVAILFTLIAVAGLTNAVNILDGFNGLASGTALIILLFFALMAFQVGDHDLADIALILAACVLGFMLCNYPFGKIFLGDSGAYFIGFMMAWLAILLPVRNLEVSPWASLLVCAYPVWEAIFSMYRRAKNKTKSTRADDLHMHSLLKTRWIRKQFAAQPSWLKNALVAPLIWLTTLVMGVLAIEFMAEPVNLMICFVVFVVIYGVVYRKLAALPRVEVGSGN